MKNCRIVRQNPRPWTLLKHRLILEHKLFPEHSPILEHRLPLAKNNRCVLAQLELVDNSLGVPFQRSKEHISPLRLVGVFHFGLGYLGLYTIVCEMVMTCPHLVPMKAFVVAILGSQHLRHVMEGVQMRTVDNSRPLGCLVFEQKVLRP